MCHKRVEIDFKIGVAFAVYSVAIAFVIGVEVVGGLPCVGHSVAIGVGGGSGAVECGPCAPVVSSIGGLVVVL